MNDSNLDCLLGRARVGDDEASAELFSVVYPELKRMAAWRMRGERFDHTLTPTALVNEAYMRLLPSQSAWESRAYFFGAAAEAMRRVLVDHARARLREKRGSGAERVTLSDLFTSVESIDMDVILLDQALTALEKQDERLALVVKLRYFVDLSIEETADVLDVSAATVKREWSYARAWLLEKMTH